MSGVFDEGRNFVLDVLFGGTQSLPATYYVALLTAEPTETTTGSTLTEPSGGAYARASIPNNSGSWNAAESGLKTSAVAITYATPTADWGVINYYAITTALSGGKAIFWGELTVARSVTSGTPPVFDAGSFAITASAVQPSIVT